MALERATWLGSRFGARIQWLPFDLHPEYPPEGIPRAELDARYGEESRRRVAAMIEQAGLTYNPPPEVVPNSHLALELAELAREHGLHEEMHQRLMRAYWSEAQNIGDRAMLLALAEEVGLDPAEAAAALDEGRYRDRVQASTGEANRIGIHAIPAFVLDSRMLLLGAQPHEVFEQAFEQLAATP